MSSSFNLTMAHGLQPHGLSNISPNVLPYDLIVHAELPSDEQVIAAAREVLEASKGWKKGKTYQKNTVRTYSRLKGPGDGAPWYCRVSEHTADEATFDEFWSKIGFNHAENEKEYVRLFLSEECSQMTVWNRYIDIVKKTTSIKKISATQEIWSSYYEFPSFVVSPRVFTVLQITHYESSSPRTGCVNSTTLFCSTSPSFW
jgi:hypothetical protein